MKYCTEDFFIPSKHDNTCAEEVVWLGKIFSSPLHYSPPNKFSITSSPCLTPATSKKFALNQMLLIEVGLKQLNTLK
jgi:hypothetical protein